MIYDTSSLSLVSYAVLFRNFLKKDYKLNDNFVFFPILCLNNFVQQGNSPFFSRILRFPLEERREYIFSKFYCKQIILFLFLLLRRYPFMLTVSATIFSSVLTLAKYKYYYFRNIKEEKKLKKLRSLTMYKNYN